MDDRKKMLYTGEEPFRICTAHAGTFVIYQADSPCPLHNVHEILEGIEAENRGLRARNRELEMEKGRPVAVAVVNEELLAVAMEAVESQEWDGDDPDQGRWLSFYNSAREAISHAQALMEASEKEKGDAND